MKRHSPFLLFPAVWCLLQLPSFADSQLVDGVVWVYKIESDESIVTGVRSEQRDLIVPSVLGGCQVVTIDARSFAEYERVASIEIPEGVMRIGNRAFEECPSLGFVSIPGSVTNIGRRAFAVCDSLSSVILGEGITTIGKEVFADCVRLTELAFPSSLRTIGEAAFLNCRSLRTLDFASVETIGDSAFLGCSGLQAVMFPETLRAIGADAFADCHDLLLLSVPNGVTNIQAGAFSGCHRLEFALLPTSFKETYADLGIPEQCIVRFWDAPDVDISYQVVFDANGGTGDMPPQMLDYGRFNALEKSVFKRKNYVFVGWSTSQTGAIALADEASVRNLAPIGDTVTLYAQWAKKSCKVKFYANGGSGKMAKQTLPYGTATKLSPNKFKRSGYVFRGWAKSKKGAVVYKNKKSVKNLDREGRTLKLYARWAKKKYKIIFHSNNGKSATARQTLTYGKSAALRGNTFEFPDHRFLGWATTPGGAVLYADGASVKNLRSDGKSFALYAVWGVASEEPTGGGDDNVADAVDFSLLQWQFGGFGGGSAQLASNPRISSLSVSHSGMSYAWVSGGCEDLGAASHTDAACLACLFCLIDGQWVGGKFDWISTSRRTRDFKNIDDGYNGWPTDAISRGEAFAFVIVSKNGRERTNVIRCDK